MLNYVKCKMLLLELQTNVYLISVTYSQFGNSYFILNYTVIPNHKLLIILDVEVGLGYAFDEMSAVFEF